MIFLFASGLALGRLVIETGAIDRLAVIIIGLQLPPGLMTMAISCTFACFLSELSSNTAAASISIPVVTGITGVMGVNPIPYILGTIVAANCAYILPVSTRAIPVGYGLNPSLQIKYGIRLSILTCATTIIICTLFMNYFRRSSTSCKFALPIEKEAVEMCDHFYSLFFYWNIRLEDYPTQVFRGL